MEFPDLSRGACREIGLELFFPEEKGNGSDTYVYAKTICNRCVVQVKCLEWAILHEDHGMWGGTSPVDRRKIRRKRKIRLNEILAREYV